ITLEDLQDMFLGHSSLRDKEQQELWLSEVAIKLVEHGSQGLDFLLERLPDLDDGRTRALLQALSCTPQNILPERLEELKRVATSFLSSERPLIVADAVDSLRALDCKELLGRVTALLSHRSPYVVGSALRFISRECPDRAVPILLRALSSP